MTSLEPFPILEIPDDAPEKDEPAGTKTEFWFRHDGLRGLFKRRKRANSGEDWAEKIAAELAVLMGIPAAAYDLAIHRGAMGVVSWSIVDPDREALILGNEILAGALRGYPLAPSPKEGRHVKQHTVRHVLAVCRLVGVPPTLTAVPELRTGADVAVGYLLFDAWIGNIDRHHQNWGWVVGPRGVYLAPSFDHGASLGHALSDREREKRLVGRDPKHSVASFLRQGRSRFWGSRGPGGWLQPRAAFEQAKALRPDAARYWQARLREVPERGIDKILGRIPKGRMSVKASEFCRRMLMESRQQVEDA